jgi:5-methylcytosine-specific restriction endonuclease McrA
VSRTDRGYRQRQRVRKIVASLYEAQSGRCASCGGRMANPGEPCEDAMLPTIDHVWPRAKNGPDNGGNMLLMHRPCNSAKADRPPNGCELIMHDMVLARLGWNLRDVRSDSASSPTMAEAFRAAKLAA